MPRRLTLATIAAVVCCASACDAPWKHDMADQPTFATATSPRPPMAGTLPVDGGALSVSRETAERTLRNPIAGAAVTQTGRELYASYCSCCHGISATGDGPVSRFFVRPADLTGAAVQQHSDGWIYATITNGTARMPRQGTELSPRERWEIVNVVRGFGKPRQ